MKRVDETCLSLSFQSLSESFKVISCDFCHSFLTQRLHAEARALQSNAFSFAAEEFFAKDHLGL